jgi:hypothetical protein
MVFLVVVNSACKNFNDKETSHTTPRGDEFIYVEDQIFKYKQDTFFAMMLNYVVEFRYLDGEAIISPCIQYEDPLKYESNYPEEVYHQLAAHFHLIKEMGFNTLRICLDRLATDDKARYFYPAGDTLFSITYDYNQIFNALEQLVTVAKKEDLRLMILLKSPLFSKELERFTIKMLDRFRDNPVIFAYDFMNEPLYFDLEPKRKKTKAYSYVKHWKHLMKAHAPNQLFTIGFAEPIEVFEWDPSFLPVDFVQFHTYHPLRVPNEIYWYSRYVNKAWMIGETSLSADNDSIPYEHQRQFMIAAFQYSRDCGATGFGWWEFQDILSNHFESQYAGLLNHQGITYTEDSLYCIQGSLKPAVHEIKTLLNYEPQKPKRPINYYNMLGYNNYRIKGRILNAENKQGIEGAVIRGWNDNWSVGMNTFSDENGYFTLYSNDENVHFEISAPCLSKIKFNNELVYKACTQPAWNIKELPARELEYQNISYQPFLNDTNSKSIYIFSFDENLFHQTKFEADMGNLYLRPL